MFDPEKMPTPPEGMFLILENDVVREVFNVLEYAAWMSEHEKDCTIGDTIIQNVRISTRFLGTSLYRQFPPTGRLVPFETMVFGGTHDQKQWRYETLEEARQGHAEVVGMVRDSFAPSPN